MKIFLCHEMTKRTEEEIIDIRSAATSMLKNKYGNDIEIIDNYNHVNAPETAGGLWHLGASIQQLELADGIYFCEPYTNSNGCAIEKHIALVYNLRILNKEIMEDGTK